MYHNEKRLRECCYLLVDVCSWSSWCDISRFFSTDLIKYGGKCKVNFFFQILSTSSLRKCLEISLENLYVDLGHKGASKKRCP